MFLTIDGLIHYLWRAARSHGEVLGILVQSTRDKKAAKRFFRKLLNGLRYVPRVVTRRVGGHAGRTKRPPTAAAGGLLP